MTQNWRWLALVGVGLALELGSAALVTNADVTAHLGTSRYVYPHVVEHYKHLFDAAACALLVQNTKHWVNPPTPLHDPSQERREPFHSVWLTVEKMYQLASMSANVAAGCLALASKMIPEGLQNMHSVGCIWAMRLS